MAKRAYKRRAPRLNVATVEDENPEVAKVVDRLDFRAHDVLDKSRPYGIVTGHEVVDGKTICYEVGQGRGRPSKLYDNECQRIYRPGEREAEQKARAAAPPKRPQRPDPQPAPPPALESADDDNDDDEEAAPPMQGVTVEAEETSVQFIDGQDEVNLTAWALGGVKYRFGLVRSAISDRYHREITNETDALDFLIGEGLVRGEEVKAARDAAAKG
jgi:hypothetical protein